MKECPSTATKNFAAISLAISLISISNSLVWVHIATTVKQIFLENGIDWSKEQQKNAFLYDYFVQMFEKFEKSFIQRIKVKWVIAAMFCLDSNLIQYMFDFASHLTEWSSHSSTQQQCQE